MKNETLNAAIVEKLNLNADLCKVLEILLVDSDTDESIMCSYIDSLKSTVKELLIVYEEVNEEYKNQLITGCVTISYVVDELEKIKKSYLKCA